MDVDDNEDGGFVSEIMMSLDTEKVKALRTEFSRRLDGLELPEFCHVMKSCLLKGKGDSKSDTSDEDDSDGGAAKAAGGGDVSKLAAMTDARLVAHFCELFEQVDVNGNGSLDWDEFTSHIVEMVMATHDHKPDIIQAYTPGLVKEVSKRRTSYIKELYYFEANDSIVTFDVDSPEFRVFDARLEQRMAVARPEGQVVCLDYMPATNQYVVSTSDLMLSIYDADSGALCKSFRTQSLQVCIVWVDSHRILYTAESSGTIRAWNVEDMEERWGGVREDPFSGSVCSQEHVSTPECRQLDSAFRSSLGFRIQVTTIESSLVKSERQAVSVAAGGPHCGKEVRDLAWRISFSCDLVSVENANLGRYDIRDASDAESDAISGERSPGLGCRVE